MLQVFVPDHATSDSLSFSNDGTTHATSVRDAAMRALQSSESVRRRLISMSAAAENTATTSGKRNRASSSSDRHRGSANNASSNGILRPSGDEAPTNGAYTSRHPEDPDSVLLPSVPSDVPRRSHLAPQRVWDAPRPATAPVFGEDPPQEYQNLYGKAAAMNGNGCTSSQASQRMSPSGGMDQHMAGMHSANSGIRNFQNVHTCGDICSHALLHPEDSPQSPRSIVSDVGVGVATGESPAAAASGSSPAPTRSALRRSVSITEKWLCPTDKRKSGGVSRAGMYSHLAHYHARM